MIQVVARAFVVLELLSAASPRTLTGLADAIGVHRSTLGNLLGTLVAAGYIARTRSGYVLTDRAAALREPLPGHERLRCLGEESCRALAEATGAGAALTVLGPRGKAVVAQVEATGDGTLLKRAGWRDSPLYASATGRVLLAEATPARRRAVLARLGPPTDGDWSEASDAGVRDRLLDAIRDNACCVCTVGDGRLSLAVPVFGRGGLPIAALGIYVAGGRKPDRSWLLRQLRQAGTALSARLARWEVRAWPV